MRELRLDQVPGASEGSGDRSSGSSGTGGILGTCNDSPCPTGTCALGVCVEAQDWFGVGDSDLGSWSNALESSTASGGGISGSTASATLPALALDSTGGLVIAWHDTSSGIAQVYVRRFDGESWVELGTLSGRDGGISNSLFDVGEPCLATGSTGDIFVGWSGTAATDDPMQIVVHRYDGTTWTPVGEGGNLGALRTDGDSRNCDLTIDAEGRPIVAFDDNSTGLRQIYVARFDDDRWRELGAGSASGGGLSNAGLVSGRPDIDVDGNGNPMVTWAHNESGIWDTYARFFDGSVWAERAGSASGGGISNTANSSFGQRLITDASGAPIVVWVDGRSGNFQVLMRRWSSNAWQEFSPGSGSAGGISNTATSSEWVSLSRDAQGRIIAAWEERVSDTRWEIYLRRYDGENWTELSSSATGGGISNSTGISSRPATALDTPDAPCVAWAESTSSGSQIALRCHGDRR